LDRWINSELHSLTAGVDKAYAAYDSQEAGKLIAAFIDDLSNWYVRRSRRRFWDGDAQALQTLYTALKQLTLLMSPMVPFITEHVWQELIRPNEAAVVESVHLATFPISDSALIDTPLSNSVQLSRRLVELGRAARAESKIKIRQPLSRALVAAAGWSAMDPEIRAHIADELNVIDLADISSAGADLVSVSIKANFKSIGARYGADVQPIASAIHGSDPEALVRSLRAQPTVAIAYGDTKSADITLDDVIITETPKQGWSVASHGGESLALDLELNDALIAAGLTREIIRAIQEKRKTDGFNISDRINVSWNGPAELVAVMQSNEKEIADEVLAVTFTQVAGATNEASEIGLWLELAKA